MAYVAVIWDNMVLPNIDCKVYAPIENLSLPDTPFKRMFPAEIINESSNEKYDVVVWNGCKIRINK